LTLSEPSHRLAAEAGERQLRAQPGRRGQRLERRPARPGDAARHVVGAPNGRAEVATELDDVTADAARLGAGELGARGVGDRDRERRRRRRRRGRRRRRRSGARQPVAELLERVDDAGVRAQDVDHQPPVAARAALLELLQRRADVALDLEVVGGDAGAARRGREVARPVLGPALVEREAEPGPVALAVVAQVVVRHDVAEEVPEVAVERVPERVRELVPGDRVLARAPADVPVGRPPDRRVRGERRAGRRRVGLDLLAALRRVGADDPLVVLVREVHSAPDRALG
jgi:hypothetical protein